MLIAGLDDGDFHRASTRAVSEIVKIDTCACLTSANPCSAPPLSPRTNPIAPTANAPSTTRTQAFGTQTQPRSTSTHLLTPQIDSPSAHSASGAQSQGLRLPVFAPPCSRPQTPRIGMQPQRTRLSSAAVQRQRKHHRARMQPSGVHTGLRALANPPPTAAFYSFQRVPVHLPPRYRLPRSHPATALADSPTRTQPLASQRRRTQEPNARLRVRVDPFTRADRLGRLLRCLPASGAFGARRAPARPRPALLPPSAPPRNDALALGQCPRSDCDGIATCTADSASVSTRRPISRSRARAALSCVSAPLERCGVALRHTWPHDASLRRDGYRRTQACTRARARRAACPPKRPPHRRSPPPRTPTM
ncbi:hypothetical protein B0H15DRAFT_346145 [Mycena belliarum]|uniref:Uncharacterized protein n=1 Tax=Mycena belliarum TaxID=1033014 RepID=A0AAD6U6K9_9AGAR|nr:hypothetical protein B0H15DRAFT_346145 [Mycena belliae]